MNMRFLTTCVDKSQLPASPPNGNPYASPDFHDGYKSDWSLAKRCLFWFSMLAICVSFVLAIGLWKAHRDTAAFTAMSEGEQLARFILGPQLRKATESSQ